MADFYEKMQAIASNLLTRFNQGIIEIGVETPGDGPVHNPGPPSFTWTVLKGAARAVNGKELFSSQGAQSKPDSLLIVGDLVLVSQVTRLAQKNETWIFAPNDTWLNSGEWLDEIAWDYVFEAMIMLPRPGYRIRFGGPSGEVWTIIKFDPVPAVGTAAAWKIYIRRG